MPLNCMHQPLLIPTLVFASPTHMHNQAASLAKMGLLWCVYTCLGRLRQEDEQRVKNWVLDVDSVGLVGVPHAMFMSTHSDNFQWHPLRFQSQQIESVLSSTDITWQKSFGINESQLNGMWYLLLLQCTTSKIFCRFKQLINRSINQSTISRILQKFNEDHDLHLTVETTQV